MKAKYTTSTGTAIIAGSIFYLSGQSKNKANKIKPIPSQKTGEEKIRRKMHHASETRADR